jgi:c(7)-type cytochrome triheme protein
MRPTPHPPWLGTAALAIAACLSPVVLAAAFPAVLRIPRRNPGAAAVPPRALFSHRTHGSFGCYACHPSVFPQAPIGFTHAEMREGRFCGRCHDGATSFPIEGAACGRCHVDAR